MPSYNKFSYKSCYNNRQNCIHRNPYSKCKCPCYYYKSINYIKDTLAADALLTFFMAVLPADTRVDVSYLKTAIIGGIMAGVGIGMVLRTEITTGGTDLLAGLIVERSRYLSVVVIMNIIDALIIIAGAFAFGIREYQE